MAEVLADGEDGGALKFSAGDKYRVLECDADVILIEVLSDPDNPVLRVQRVLDDDLNVPNRGRS